MTSIGPGLAGPASSPGMLTGSFDSRKAVLFVGYADRISPKQSLAPLGTAQEAGAS